MIKLCILLQADYSSTWLGSSQKWRRIWTRSLRSSITSTQTPTSTRTLLTRWCWLAWDVSPPSPPHSWCSSTSYVADRVKVAASCGSVAPPPPCQRCLVLRRPLPPHQRRPSCGFEFVSVSVNVQTRSHLVQRVRRYFHCLKSSTSIYFLDIFRNPALLSYGADWYQIYPKHLLV